MICWGVFVPSPNRFSENVLFASIDLYLFPSFSFRRNALLDISTGFLRWTIFQFYDFAININNFMINFYSYWIDIIGNGIVERATRTIWWWRWRIAITHNDDKRTTTNDDKRLQGESTMNGQYTTHNPTIKPNIRDHPLWQNDRWLDGELGMITEKSKWG